jgi:hypothetical protein
MQAQIGVYLAMSPRSEMSRRKPFHPEVERWAPALLLALTLLPAAGAVLAADPNEPNDDFANATPISCPSFDSVDTAIGGSDVDYYLLTGTAGLVVLIDIDTDTLSLLDSILGAFDSSFVQIGFSDDESAPGEPATSDSYLEVIVPSDGTFFIAVSAFEDLDFDGIGGTSSGTYSMSVRCPDAPVTGDLLGSTGRSGGALIDIDPNTGAAALRAAHGEFGPITEIEFRDDGTLIGATGGGSSVLVDIDPVTGVETLRCSHLAGAINGLEFIGDTLFGAHITSAGSPSNLVIVGEPDGFGICPVTVLGLTGFGNLGGLAYDATSTTLFGCTASFPGGGTLVTCDTVTGTCTSVGPTGFTECSALEFGPGGTLYGGIGGVSVDGGDLIIIDPGTGAGTEVGPTGFSVVSGLGFLPGPCATPPTLCDTGGTLCTVSPGASPQAVDLIIENAGPGFVTNILGVEIQHNGAELRTAPGATEADQLINSLTLLGTLPEDLGSNPLTFTDTTYVLDPGEIVGYLATSESLCDGSDGPLGGGRGTIDASSLPAAAP